MKSRLIRDGLLTAFVMVAVFAIVLLMDTAFAADSLIPMLFVLGVFVISRQTEGYLWGIVASLLGVLAVNYAFMFPYYAIDLLTPVNLATAVVMLVVSVMTSTLTTQISIQEKEKAAAERERMRANLLRAISHDLRTPLTSISGVCSLLMEEQIPRQEQMELLRNMRKDAQWLTRMVENLLAVTRIDKAQALVTKTPTVLEELIGSVLVKFSRHYPETPVETELPGEFATIPMDAMLIEQVLLNLLENAVTHARGMTRLILRVSLEEGGARFAVEDNGCGIPKERLDSLFTGQMPQSDHTRSGMGIGLYVCAAIIRAHGSGISAANLPQGGAIFAFTLEMEEKDEQQ
ncbi:MAG: PAS domain-containing sensor histidine kinase [Clostridia bacterium]|nr:PAS domain-containing sensor histidine kinase [Clostridia bacterium]